MFLGTDDNVRVCEQREKNRTSHWQVYIRSLTTEVGDPRLQSVLFERCTVKRDMVVEQLIAYIEGAPCGDIEEDRQV